MTSDGWLAIARGFSGGGGLRRFIWPLLSNSMNGIARISSAVRGNDSIFTITYTCRDHRPTPEKNPKVNSPFSESSTDYWHTGKDFVQMQSNWVSSVSYYPAPDRDRGTGYCLHHA